MRACPSLLVTAAALAGALLPSAGRSADASPFVTANGGALEVCDYTFTFVGFNVRGICHFGHGDVLPYSHANEIDFSLDYCASAKANVIRVFCSVYAADPIETGDRLEVVLGACRARGIYVIAALTDMYLTGLHPAGDQAYYTNYGAYTMLNHTFFAGGYTVHYLPQALYLADRFKDHPALFAWQLGNEIRDLSSGSTFVAFCQDATAQIRAADPNHMVNPGLIGWRQANVNYAQAAQIYGVMDFVGSHNYNGSDFDNDSGLAADLNLPYVIDEAGFHSDDYGPDRTPETDADIAKWLGRGADGYLQWGLMASGSDNGDGDWYFGVDLVFHETDFWLYRDLFNAYGTGFEVPPTLSVEPATIERTVPLGAGADDVLTVHNAGSGTLDFVTTESASWLWLSPTAGRARCSGAAIAVHYDTALLLPGVYSTSIEVSADGVGGSPQHVQVTLTVAGKPGDFDGDGDVDQSDHGRFQTCFTGPGTTQDLPGCAPARMDDDLDVDQDDADLFVGCMSGANTPADPQCAG